MLLHRASSPNMTHHTSLQPPSVTLPSTPSASYPSYSTSYPSVYSSVSVSTPVVELQLAAERAALQKAKQVIQFSCSLFAFFELFMSACVCVCLYGHCQATHNASVRLHFRHLTVDTLSDCVAQPAPPTVLTLNGHGQITDQGQCL